MQAIVRIGVVIVVTVVAINEASAQRRKKGSLVPQDPAKVETKSGLRATTKGKREARTVAKNNDPESSEAIAENIVNMMHEPYWQAVEKNEKLIADYKAKIGNVSREMYKQAKSDKKLLTSKRTKLDELAGRLGFSKYLNDFWVNSGSVTAVTNANGGTWFDSDYAVGQKAVAAATTNTMGPLSGGSSPPTYVVTGGTAQAFSFRTS